VVDSGAGEAALRLAAVILGLYGGIRAWNLVRSLVRGSI
jgi:hypothetical protein